ncbi:MAG: metallophosphoesterase family protein [Verrucomicrobia bacterium]|nr:metallophosphoesterase family protein [Verrucomicrobiota bacterium]
MGFSEGNVSAAGLQNGTNVLAVEVHQFDSDNPDLSFDLGLAGWLEVADAGLVRGPYLQTATPTNLVVCWRTDLAVGGRVRYGTNPADLNLVAESLALATNHEVRLDGLTPSTRFFYSVEAPPLVLAGGAECSFITPPPVGVPKPTRVWVLGDSGTANANAQAVRDAYEQFAGTSPTDLWLMLGDNAYGSGFDHEYQRAVFEMYPTTLRQVPLWPTLGNHDWYAVQYVGHIPYLNIFRLPAQGEAGGVASGTELYYSFDYAHIHFVCLDSMSSSREPTGPMLEWLRNDLGQTTQDWIIAFWHHPPYSRGSHNSDAEGELIDMRANALPILEEFGADLVLCGHSHSYERSYLLHGHYGSSQTLAPGHILDSGDGREDGDGAYLKPAGGLGAGQGTVYTVAGSSGQTSGGSLNHPAMFISLNRLGSLVLDIVSNRLEAAFLQSDGVVADHFTLRKGAFTNGPAPAMTILRAGQGTAVVAWPTSQLPYAMQSTPDVTVTDAWHPATNVPWQVGGTNFIRLDTTGSNQFLRLRRQQP